ncbi:hypothetical protein BN1708_005320 [Verticillium longisporum]|uniref:Uncharacterized protein n=1 Tax=Verticillium longisporum TaxID=100787 RepID=A0A0G4MAD8_VERLO|nr:hypothetical protein BN1708_005320 [Verticillium longisporum]
MAPRGNLNPRTVVAPLAAFTMACLLFTYTRSSIRTAREQANLAADMLGVAQGGQALTKPTPQQPTQNTTVK